MAYLYRHRKHSLFQHISTQSKRNGEHRALHTFCVTEIHASLQTSKHFFFQPWLCAFRQYSSSIEGKVSTLTYLYLEPAPLELYRKDSFCILDWTSALSIGMEVHLELWLVPFLFFPA